VKKKPLRLATAIVVFAMAAAMSAAPALAAHTSPVTGLPCNNTGCTYTHGSFLQNVATSTHKLSSGVICSTTAQLYYHTQKCSSCAAILSNTYSLQCRLAHSSSACGYYPTEKTDSNCK